MSPSKRDKHFSEPQSMIVDFVFDGAVAQVFPDMIRRSVPGYDALISLMGLFAAQYAQADSVIFDLGCSTGATSLALSQRINVPGCSIIAVDSSQAMVQKCRQNTTKLNIPVDVICADIGDINIRDASIVTLNFTLQFLAQEKRAALIQSIYAGLKPGGVLILSEKIIFADKQTQSFHEEMHRLFKSANGYSDLEIAQKRTALENVLIPDSLDTHKERLSRAGFTHIHAWHQCLNFISICAKK